MTARASRVRATLLLAGVLALLSACGRPTGDFGRARPSPLHDEVFPGAGAIVAAHRGEPVSAFNRTDTERELADRAFAFVRPPHAGDWWQEALVEGQRTRLLPALDPGFDPAVYYAFLRAGPYRSSEARWSKVIEDVQGDTLLVPPFCAVAARVRRADAERIAAVWRVEARDLQLVSDVYARVYENDETMAWVWRALDYRLRAYRIAIDRMQVETPSDKLWETNQAWIALAGTRCADAPAARTLPDGPPRASRRYRGPDPFDQPVLQK